MFLTELILSNPAVNPEELENIYDLNWKLVKTDKYYPNGNGEVLRYKEFRPNSNMYVYGYQPTIDPSTGERTYDETYLRYPDLTAYEAGTNYLGRTNDSHGSYVYVLNEAADHYTLHNFGSEPNKVISDLEVNEPAIMNTMADENYVADSNQPNENTVQYKGVPHSVYTDDNWKNTEALIYRTVDAPFNTARVYECIETHKGAQKLLGYNVELIIRNPGSGYQVNDELIIENRFIEQRIKVLSVDSDGGITDFEVIAVKESGQDMEISGHTFKSNRNIDNTLGDSTAYVDYGCTYPAGHEYDDNTRDKVITGGGATFNYDCTPYYDDYKLAFYDPEEFNRWAYVKDIIVYCEGDIVLATDIAGSNTYPTLNKYECNTECVPLANWSQTSDNFTLVSTLNGTEAPYDLQWVKANDLLTDAQLSNGSTYYLNNTSDTAYQYLVSDEDPNNLDTVPIGATATGYSQVRLELDGELWLKVPFGHYLTLNIEEVQ